MNKRTSVLLVFFVSFFSVIYDENHKKIPEIDLPSLSYKEHKNFLKSIENVKVNMTEKLKVFLKKELGIEQLKPKSLYEMSFEELLNEINPWGHKKEEVCNDNLKCLMGLYTQLKYQELINRIRFFAAKTGYDLSEERILILFLSSLWVLKILTGYVLFIDIYK